MKDKLFGLKNIGKVMLVEKYIDIQYNIGFQFGWANKLRR